MAFALPFFNLAPDLTVSKLCLGLTFRFIRIFILQVPEKFCLFIALELFITLSGTMTFGEQNTSAESFKLLDKAFNSGVNFFDSAEMYPVPQRAETHGRSEEYFGRWIRERKVPRDNVVLATKVSGPSGQMSWIRNGPESLDAQNITEAIDNSLLRIKTDYIDLYQIHWPDRYVPMFGETDYDPLRHYTPVSFEEQLDALERAVDAGKIRYIGLSNETPYGIMKFQQVAKSKAGNLQIVSVQNAYNLLCRNFDLAMAECCHNERISLLAYSPLAMGILSGKYFAEDGGPSNARLNLFKGRYKEGESRYDLSKSNVLCAAKSYIDIADRYDIHPVSLAIAFIMRHPLVASVVFGASKVWQLEEVLDACKVNLSHEIITEINTVHLRFPSPCP
ncbi:protein tas isoform X4 [Capsicum galapagoense]